MTKDDSIKTTVGGFGKELTELRTVLNDKLDELAGAIQGIADEILKGLDEGKAEPITVPKHPYHTALRPQGTCRICLPLERDITTQDEEALELHAHDLLLRLRMVMDKFSPGFQGAFEEVAGLVGQLIVDVEAARTAVELRETAVREVGDDPFLIRPDERGAVMDALWEVHDRINTERDHGKTDEQGAWDVLDRVLSRMARASPAPEKKTVQVRLLDLKREYHVVEVPVAEWNFDSRALTVVDDDCSSRSFIFSPDLSAASSFPTFIEERSVTVNARLG